MSRGDCSRCDEELRNGQGLCDECEAKLRADIAEYEETSRIRGLEIARLEARIKDLVSAGRCLVWYVDSLPYQRNVRVNERMRSLVEDSP